VRGVSCWLVSNREALGVVLTSLGGFFVFLGVGEWVRHNHLGWGSLALAGLFFFVGSLLKR
jgi:hypothetical protein